MYMIKTPVDFDYAINKIIEGTNPSIYLQGDILDSEYMNKTFTEIENTLNTLYEKTRYLEDSIAYTKNFLDERINKFSNNVDSILKSIENEADSAKNLSYISYNVPFVKNTDILHDRGRTTNIRPLIIRNKSLTLDYKVNKDQEFSFWKRESDHWPYISNIDNVKNEPYRSIFLEEKLVQNGVSETIYVSLDGPTEINFLDIKPVNCVIKNLKFGLINGIEENVGDYSVDMPINSRMCTYIKFDLVCQHYDLIEYNLDKDIVNSMKDSTDIWSRVKEFEYNQMANVQTKFDASMIISKIIKNSNSKEKVTVAYAPEENKRITTLNMFSYVFGIDSFSIKNSEHYTDGYMISDPITIGALKEEEYIRLDVQQQRNECCEISYSILDGDVEIPISIMDDDIIENELIFNNVDTRFEVDFDASSSYEGDVIKKNGAIVEMSYIDAKAKAIENTDRYSISYKTGMDHYNYKPINKTIQVKCYIRAFGKMKCAPYISKITIRKYGEESLWINRH